MNVAETAMAKRKEQKILWSEMSGKAREKSVISGG